MICGVFPARGNRRLNDISYYQEMGAGLYFRYYDVAKKEIGYHMSHRFATMAEIVRDCMDGLSDDP